MIEPDELSRRRLADSPVEIISGSGALAALPELLRELGWERVLVVCGRQVGRLPALTEMLDSAPELFVGVFDEVEPDPSDRTVAAGGTRARELGAQAILGLGGGSSLDAAKALAAETVEPGWVAAQDRPGQPTEAPPGVLPVLAVPTTAGTGSEVTPFSVITFTAERRKLVLNHPALYPRLAVLDPLLLVSAPREVRVAAGMDALTHAVESYLSLQATDPTRTRSLAAAEGVMQHLPEAATDSPCVEDLAALQWAALLAGVAFSMTRLGVVHAAALPLSALFGVPHGVANAILLPHGMAYNLPAAGKLLENLAAAWNVLPRGASSGAPFSAVEAVRDLAQQVGAPARMRDVGVDAEAIPRMAEQAASSAHLKVNPRPVGLEDLIALYQAAY